MTTKTGALPPVAYTHHVTALKHGGTNARLVAFQLLHRPWKHRDKGGRELNWTSTIRNKNKETLKQ
jgi:hypothetical protein